MTYGIRAVRPLAHVSTHMPLARHDKGFLRYGRSRYVSTHMPLARHDINPMKILPKLNVSTHMPLARHDFFFSEIMQV